MASLSSKVGKSCMKYTIERSSSVGRLDRLVLCIYALFRSIPFGSSSGSWLLVLITLVLAELQVQASDIVPTRRPKPASGHSSGISTYVSDTYNFRP